MADVQDVPISVAAIQMQRLIDKGFTVYGKFTCESCGARQMFDTPNTLYTSGACEECGYVTDLRERGVGYLMVSVAG